MSSKFSNIHALLIGINQYTGPKLKPLIHAAKDAERLKAALIEIGAKEENIVLLQDEHATKVNILEKVKALGTNESKVNRGDPIVFFFSGYSGKTTLDVKDVGVLCPQDVDSAGGIGDFYLQESFDIIARTRGNNIVRKVWLRVIFDWS